MLLIRESYINASKGYHYGDTELYRAYTDDKGKLFKSLQSEYGRCTGKMYIDTTNGQTREIGYVFEKKVRYTDTDESYLQQTWVEIQEIVETEKVQTLNTQADVIGVWDSSVTVEYTNGVQRELPYDEYNKSWKFI